MGNAFMPCVLLFGLPRSGTTWVAKVVDSHPLVLYRHEPDRIVSMNQIPMFPEASCWHDYQDLVRKYVEMIPSITYTSVVGKYPIFHKDYRKRLETSALKVALMVSKIVSANKKDSKVFLEPTKIPPGATLVWKSIESLGRLGVIAAALPESYAVPIVRHPCGFVASVLGGERSGKFANKQPSSDDYGVFGLMEATSEAKSKGLTVDCLKKMSPEERLAWKWCIFNEKAMNDLALVGRYKIVMYDEFCLDPLNSFKGLFEFVGLEWCRQSHDFIVSSTSVNRRSGYYSVFKDPLRSSRSWRDVLTQRQIDLIIGVVREAKMNHLVVH